MELQTISQVTKTYGISTRMLRYYEQIGLVKSQRRDDYAYRVYDEAACARLRQILILRKLRIPLKQIAEVLADAEATAAVAVFEDNVRMLDSEINALSVIRGILSRLLVLLRERANVTARLDLLNDAQLIAVIDNLPPSPNNLREDKVMDNLDQANSILSQLKDVRIVYLPPATVAASHYIGPESENHAGAAMEKFINDTKLWEIKPDMRSYGFNHPNEVKGTDYHGYEFWVTIPDDMEVPAPLTKKHFPGGLYAAHMIPMGNFHEWQWLTQWVAESPDYHFNFSDEDGECMHGMLEECLNYIQVVRNAGTSGNGPGTIQLDLLCPIKPKQV